MDFSIKACDWNEAFQNGFMVSKADCIVVGVFESEPLAGPARALDVAGEGLLTRLMRSGDIDGKAGSTLVLHEVAGIDASRVLVVGLGRRDKFNQKAFIEAARGAWRALSATRSAHAVWALAQERVEGRDAAWAARMSVVVARDLAYKFTRMKAAPETAAPALRKVTLTVDALDEKAAKAAVKRGVAIANGVDLTRDLGNLPPNVCTPTYLADTAKTMARDFKLKVEVLGQKQLEAANMGSFLAVAKGSVEPPQFIILQYQGASAKQAPVVLVGKGITFDSGGISLKAGEGMDEMKYDMLGAGSVLGAMRAIAEIAPKLNLICVVPTCENMPAGNASKPGDIVRTMSGKTVEILNTDAEGRLILCDALTYVERFKPAAVVDVATLTGACIIALGHHRSAMYASDDALAEALMDASQQSADPVWRMPLDEEYKDQLKSNFADLANIGGRPAGSVTAACFLASFTQAYPWAHLDIAGTAWKSGAAKGATGRPVPLLTEYLLNQSA